MSHEVTTRKNGMAEIAYVGDTPWHGLGQRLEEGASIEAWKVSAGMDWRICRSRVRCGEGPSQQIYDDKHVLFRSDTKAPLSIVSHKYQVVQPGEVLEFFRDLTEANGFQLHTAGTLFGGQRFWALASIGEEAIVMGEDKVGGFLLLSSSCDGSMATTARFTSVRVVCNNTPTMAVSGKKAEVVVRHTSRFDAKAAKDELGLARGQFQVFMKEARRLAQTKVSDAVVSTYLESLLAETKTMVGEKKPVSESKQYQRILQLFRSDAMGGSLLGAQGTAWGLVNAVTQFVDHEARARSTEQRLATAWYGRGEGLKNAAMAKALELAS